MCVCARMCVHVCVCMCVYVCVFHHAHQPVCEYVCIVYVCLCMYVCVYLCMYACMGACVLQGEVGAGPARLQRQLVDSTWRIARGRRCRRPSCLGECDLDNCCARSRSALTREHAHTLTLALSVSFCRGQLLLEDVHNGGCVASANQGIMLTLAVLCPEDVSRIRLGLALSGPRVFCADVSLYCSSCAAWSSSLPAPCLFLSLCAAVTTCVRCVLLVAVSAGSRCRERSKIDAAHDQIAPITPRYLRSRYVCV